ncbi:hypothetical protein PR202_gb19323 [Eleusine coracana subsp. coracana]|uniref:TLC domain-containing protein n=1 Tax=Eleusine coracana subsp. coracana TaxID=191504 RepID=A0AAV5F803_ELECO|nr:hypothetical protein PR202_gb19323 [Eleusine coracana subsp. coracana]
MAIQGAEATYIMLLFSVAFFCARFLLDRLVYKPLAVYLFSRLMNDEAKQVKIVKFSESIWKLTYYASVQAWVLSIIKQEPWSLDKMQYFDGWPNQYMAYYSIPFLRMQPEFPTSLYYMFNTMLLTLFVFHVYWGKLIFLMIKKQLNNRGQVGDDVRSDSEEEE